MAGKMGTAVVQCLYNHPQGSTVCSRTHLTMTWANTVRPYGRVCADGKLPNLCLTAWNNIRPLPICVDYPKYNCISRRNPYHPE